MIKLSESGLRARYALVSILAVIFLTSVASASANNQGSAEVGGHLVRNDLFATRDVSGTGVHLFSSSIVHSQSPTEHGMIQRSTDIVRLEGDLHGTILYHPRSVLDFDAGTLVNTGHQVFSGTILGSPPVMLHDDAFRFEVDLATGETLGEVYLLDRIAGPVSRCRLIVVGTGATAAGDATFAYSGTCRVHPRAQPAQE